ncbi:hypothetical protein GCM10007042_41070 [Butyricimonas paravirosa]|nr:hypothetical protein GCM10007042_41070 [Butyricimonas paravirosa]
MPFSQFKVTVHPLRSVPVMTGASSVPKEKRKVLNAHTPLPGSRHPPLVEWNKESLLETPLSRAAIRHISKSPIARL